MSPTTTVISTHPAVDFITALFEATDLLAFMLLRGKDASHQFVTAAEAATPEFVAQLAAKNDEGFNVYVAMNVFKPGSTRRTIENVAVVRNVWTEIDEDGPEKLATIFASKLVPDPSIVLESSPSKYQFIWKVKDLTPDEASALVKSLAAEFGGDPNATDLARVLRVPGFKNHKYADQPVVEIVHESETMTKRYTKADFTIPQQAVSPASEIVRSERGLVIHGYIHTYMFQQASRLREMGLGGDALDSALCSVVEANCEPPIDFDKVHTMARWVNDNQQAGDPTRGTVLLHGKPLDSTIALVVAEARSIVAGAITGAIDQLQQQAAAEEPWGTPEELPGLYPVKSFDPAWLPDAIRPWVEDIAYRMRVPLDFSAISALSTLAGVTGRRAFVFPKELDKDWQESLALSGGVIAASGRVKSPVWKAYVNMVFEQDADWSREHEAAVKQYKIALEKWEREQKAIEKQKKEPFQIKAEGDTSRIAPIAEGSSEPTPPPPCRRLMLNDATPESMHERMMQNSEGLFYYKDELSSWVKELSKKDRESQRGIFLAAMNGNDAYTVDRIGRGNVPALMCLSVFGSFQPEMFEEFISDTKNVADGMIPRFSLLVWPDDLDRQYFDRSVNDGAKAKFRDILRKLAAAKEDTIWLHFTTDAQRRFEKWSIANDHKINTMRHSGKRSHLSKYQGALPKLAGLLQLVDLMAAPGEVHGTHKIDIDHLSKAIQIFEYLESHMHRLYNCLKPTSVKAEEALVQLIQDGRLKDGLSSRDIVHNNWENLKDRDDVDDALDSLAERHWVRAYRVNSGQGSRSTDRWNVNPALKKS